MIESGTFVVVTTDMNRRGVFGGELVSNDGNGNVTLKDARMCVYWDVKTRGVVGLASKGPQSGCRITGAVPTIELDGVAAVMQATDEAKSAWESEPWAS